MQLNVVFQSIRKIVREQINSTRVLLYLRYSTKFKSRQIFAISDTQPCLLTFSMNFFSPSFLCTCRNELIQLEFELAKDQNKKKLFIFSTVVVEAESGYGYERFTVIRDC